MKEFAKLKIATVAFLIVSIIGILIAIDSKPTEFKGVGAGRNGDITVAIKVENGKIIAGRILHEEETDFAKPAAKQVISQAIATGGVENLDTISGATLTSVGTAQALKAALEASRGANVSDNNEQAKDTQCDIVIIGAGGAGMISAIQANKLGAKVILLEKMGIVGGNTTSATGGLNAAETIYQEQKGIKDSKEQYFTDTMNGGHNINDKDLVKTMVENAPSTVDYLVALGADLTDVGKMAGSTNSRTHRPQGGAAVGPHLVKVLKENCEKQGIDLRLNSKAVKILNDDGKVAGVKVEVDKKTYTIKAKAVIIATGGFGANAAMVVSYRPELEGFGTTNHKGATGDGLILASDFDAALVDIDQIQTHPTVVPGNGLMITEAVRGNGAIMINREGKRFGSEMATRDVMSSDILSQTGKTAYLLFDQGVRESLKAIEGYANKGLLTQGESIADLAAKLNIDATTLEETITKYNEAQKTGNDTEFNRKASEMPRALETAPYYAVEVGPAIHHTMGGLKITTKAQVVNKSGNIIPGLFAAGEVTGGVHGDNRLGGNAVADICVFGKIAADSACDYIK